ncbi:MAG TPA: hypothetical protein VHY35_23790 [Stellaceae bacterium]|jgi:hypothetical protein|nr:hypothetical protein [Stellaceae bacterium]
MTGAHPDEIAALRLRFGPEVWHRICRHLDGIAIGSTVAALTKAGVLSTLERAAAPLDIDALAAAHQSPRGCFHLAMRLLEEQGWVERAGAGEGGRKTVGLTAAGRGWLPYAGAYANSAAALAVAQDLFTALVRGTGFDQRRLRVMHEAIPATGDVAERVRDHQWGALAAAAASGLYRSGRIDDNGSAAAAAFAVLRHQGWATAEPGALSDAGRLALEWSAQYDHSISYFPTFAAIEERLFPSAAARQRETSDLDRHLDRRLDIDFSGNVFSRTCRDSFFELALPLFDMPLAGQPAAIIDTGAGDGSLLRELYGAIRDRTRRGQALTAQPLTMVGVEPSAIAREVMARSLADAGVPAIVVDGDIADPAAIADRLAPHGVDFAAALHVCKSVIHDRLYRPCDQSQAALTTLPWPPSDAVFVAEDDTLISHAALQADLIRHFRTWRPWIAQQGMIVIEVHTVPAELIAAHEGSNVMTGLDASHGYSHQYLVERPTYLRAAAEAGLSASATRALAAEMLGTPIMTIDHWWPTQVARRSA